MPQVLTRIFLNHPKSVDETYFEHMCFAAWFASQLFMASMAALVHAIIPSLFEKTASRKITNLYERMARRD